MMLNNKVNWTEVIKNFFGFIYKICCYNVKAKNIIGHIASEEIKRKVEGNFYIMFVTVPCCVLAGKGIQFDFMSDDILCITLIWCNVWPIYLYYVISINDKWIGYSSDKCTLHARGVENADVVNWCCR